MPHKRKGEHREKGNFSAATMEKALAEYEKSGKLRETAKKYGLSKSTLGRYIEKQKRGLAVFEPNYAVNKVFWRSS